MKSIDIAELKPKMRFCVGYRSQEISHQGNVFEALAVDSPRVVANCIASAPAGDCEAKNPVVFDKKSVMFLLCSEDYVNALLKGESK